MWSDGTYVASGLDGGALGARSKGGGWLMVDAFLQAARVAGWLGPIECLGSCGVRAMWWTV